MKNKLWLLSIPVIILSTLAFAVTQMRDLGYGSKGLVSDSLYPPLRTVSGIFTNLKFRMRGETRPKNKVVIVEIDSPSLETIGRWPWHRDATALLIDSIFAAGAKVVGLDMVFSEEDQRVPDELRAFLGKQNLGNFADQFETDFMLRDVIVRHRDRLVLGWATETSCQPSYSNSEDCRVGDPIVAESYPTDMDHLGLTHFMFPPTFDFRGTPVMSLWYSIPNLPIYNQAAFHAGYFNGFPDSDGFIRRTTPIMLYNKKPFPSLPLEMARVGLNEDIKAEFGSDGRLTGLWFAKSGRKIDVSPAGIMEVNFRGKSFTFPYVSALDVMNDQSKQVKVNRVLASSKADVFKDAYVLIGLSAIGVHDMRAFPFDSNTPGVEGHATILDNILSDDYLRSSSTGFAAFMMYFLMIAGALAFAYFTQKFESVPALLLFLGVFGGVGFVDQKILFENNILWNTSFLYIELVTIFMMILAAKYVLEERNKKFIKGAFAKYVAPSIVDSILKDPTKLTVGGEKKDLTILFSDIRGFTSFSERMDAKELSHFLNEYLGDMTDIIFQNEGTLDKYIGDAIMAFWGAPLDQPAHAYNACQAAIQMLQKLDSLKRPIKQKYGIEVSIGIGINSGAVSVGNMGSDRIFSYTVIGDHVNLASRLEGLTKPYGAKIVTTRFTFDMIQSGGHAHPPHRVLDFVKVKGKKQAVELIHVLERDYSKEGLEIFEEGRKLYTGQKWDDAIRRFRDADRLLKGVNEDNDGPSQMYIERCEMFKQTPPDADWDGSWEMTSK